jgi:actin-related protein
MTSWCCGDDAIGLPDARRAMSRGVVQEWEHVTALWYALPPLAPASRARARADPRASRFACRLAHSGAEGVRPRPRARREHTMGMAVSPLPLADGFPMLASEPPKTTKMDKELYTQMLFEDMHATSVALVNQAQLTLTTFAESTAVVIDLGHETIDVTPVVKGTPAPGASRHLPIGGLDMAGKLAELLAAKGTELTEREAISVFEQTACAAPQPMAPGAQAPSAAAAAASSVEAATATLADGRRITVSAEDRQACVEPIFTTRSWAGDGSGVGLAIAVHEAVISCAEAYDKDDKKDAGVAPDRDLREQLFHSVLIVGGCAMIPGLRERLLDELGAMGTYGVDLTLKEPAYYMPGCEAGGLSSPEAARKCTALQYAAFLGAGVMAADRRLYEGSSFSRAQYDEVGPYICHKLPEGGGGRGE